MLETPSEAPANPASTPIPQSPRCTDAPVSTDTSGPTPLAIVTPPEQPAALNHADSSQPLAEENTASKPKKHATRKGNVARLPKTIRDQLNQMLLHGVPY